MRPTLVAEKLLGMSDETPDLAVPYMSTIVERFNIPKAHGAAVVSGALATNPFALTSGSAEVTVTVSAAQATQLDLRQNEPITLAGGAAIRQAASTAADATSIATTNASANVVCTLAAHGFKVGDVITIANANTTGGFGPTDLNGDRTITVKTDDTFTFVAAAPAGSTATGGGATVTYQLEEAFAATDVDGDYIVKSVAVNQQTFVIDFPKAANFTSAGVGGAAITIATVLNKTSITRQSHRSQAYTNKFVRELVLFNLSSSSLPAAGDRYVTQQTRSPAQVNEVLQMIINNVNHLPDQGINSEALRVLYLNSAQPSLNVPYIAMLGDSGSQRLANGDGNKAMIYPYGALRNNFSVTAAKVGFRVQDLRFEHQRTYGGHAGSHDAYVLLCFGTVARTLSIKNGVLNVSY